MKNFRSLAKITAIAICLAACNSEDKNGKIGTQASDSIGADSNNVDSTAPGTGGGMPRDIPNGTGTDAKKPDTGIKKGKWPSQGNPMP